MANVRGWWRPPLVLSYMAAGGGAGRCYTGTASTAAGGHRVRSRGGKLNPALTCLLLQLRTTKTLRSTSILVLDNDRTGEVWSVFRSSFAMLLPCQETADHMPSHAFFNNVFVCLVVIYMECMFALNDLFQVSNTMNTSKANLSSSSVEPNDTIYLCNFRVSVDGEWLCLKVGR